MIDDDLLSKNAFDLQILMMKMRAVIRRHRDSKGHNLCWFWPELWDFLPERYNINTETPPEAEFLDQCYLFRRSLDTHKGQVETAKPVDVLPDSGEHPDRYSS